MLDKELNGACSTAIILGLLARGENYGYGLIQLLKKQSGGRLNWAEGMLYPLLRRLEKEGFLESKWVVAPNERRRRYYAITRTGRKALEKKRQQWREANELMEGIWQLNPPRSA